jgi:hypothetical protein
MRFTPSTSATLQSGTWGFSAAISSVVSTGTPPRHGTQDSVVSPAMFDPLACIVILLVRPLEKHLPRRAQAEQSPESGVQADGKRPLAWKTAQQADFPGA